MFKPLAAGVLAAFMVVSTAAVAGTNQGALAPGKAASVKEAQSIAPTTVAYVVGAGVIIGGIALAVSGNSNGTVGTTTTCSPSGCTSTSTTSGSTSTTSTTATH